MSFFGFTYQFHDGGDVRVLAAVGAPLAVFAHWLDGCFPAVFQQQVAPSDGFKCLPRGLETVEQVDVMRGDELVLSGSDFKIRFQEPEDPLAKQHGVLIH